MSAKTIRRLKITNFKSIDSLEIKGLAPFTVFAGPNGSGKSNFFDALDFVSLFVRNGIETALRTHGGFANIHSEKRRASSARIFGFEIECDLPGPTKDEGQLSSFRYTLAIHNLDGKPIVEEYMSVEKIPLLERKKGEKPIIKGIKGVEGVEETEDKIVDQFADGYSALLFYLKIPIVGLLSDLRLYRIDPIGAKEPDKSDSDPTMLDRKGHNLASVLHRLEHKPSVQESILDLMGSIVPGIDKIQTDLYQLENKTAILFKDEGTRKRFPANMVSDGTIYALCLLVAVLDTPIGYDMTLIEEPERGLHPKAIRELIELMREQASPANPIWLSTHSESVVRVLRLEELVLVDKVNGRTKMKRADSGRLTQDDLAPLNLDEAWLSNLLDGGLPW
jgi:predicted ATPase